MKKIIKNPIFTFILGAVIFGGIVGVSAYTIFANDIGYTPKDTTWKKSNGEDITNVKDAIDELYEHTKLNFNEISSVYYNGDRIVKSLSTKLNKGKYIVSIVKSDSLRWDDASSSRSKRTSPMVTCDKNCNIDLLSGYINNVKSSVNNSFNGTAHELYYIDILDDETTITRDCSNSNQSEDAFVCEMLISKINK